MKEISKVATFDLPNFVGWGIEQETVMKNNDNAIKSGICN